jgi:hypothetical protein
MTKDIYEHSPDYLRVKCSFLVNRNLNRKLLNHSCSTADSLLDVCMVPRIIIMTESMTPVNDTVDCLFMTYFVYFSLCCQSLRSSLIWPACQALWRITIRRNSSSVIPRAQSPKSSESGIAETVRISFSWAFRSASISSVISWMPGGLVSGSC